MHVGQKPLSSTSTAAVGSSNVAAWADCVDHHGEGRGRPHQRGLWARMFFPNGPRPISAARPSPLVTTCVLVIVDRDGAAEHRRHLVRSLRCGDWEEYTVEGRCRLRSGRHQSSRIAHIRARELVAAHA